MSNSMAARHLAARSRSGSGVRNRLPLKRRGCSVPLAEGIPGDARFSPPPLRHRGSFGSALRLRSPPCPQRHQVRPRAAWQSTSDRKDRSRLMASGKVHSDAVPGVGEVSLHVVQPPRDGPPGTLSAGSHPRRILSYDDFHTQILAFCEPLCRSRLRKMSYASVAGATA